MASRNVAETSPEIGTTRRMLEDLITHVRRNVDSVNEPKAQALFETTAEVLIGLRTAYEHYEVGSEKAFRR